MTEEAFDAPDGTVWLYRYVYHTVVNSNASFTVEEELFVVLPGYCDHVEEQHPGVMFRQYLNLETGEVTWFAKDSHMNKRSTKFA